MFENIQKLGDRNSRDNMMENLQHQMVENRPDKTLKNLQENKLDNSADNGPTRIKNIFQVVKKPERIYQTRMGKRNVLGKEAGRIYMTKMGKVNNALKTSQ